MNQDEQPGENIFIMPDSLKKSDLVTVFKTRLVLYQS